MSARQRKPRITPTDVIRGQKWRYNRVPEIIGVIDCIHVGGYVHIAIDDDDDCEMTWISKIDVFLARWSRVGMP